MNQIVITHDVNRGMTTSYNSSEMGVVTIEQQRQRQHELAMAKAEAVTSRYSGICGLNPQLPVQEHRKGQTSGSHSRQQKQTKTPPDSSSTTREKERKIQRRRSSRSAEPDYLALSTSFRKSFTSVASGDLPDMSNHSRAQQGEKKEEQEELPVSALPHFKTDMTDSIKASRQNHLKKDYECWKGSLEGKTPSHRLKSPPLCSSGLTEIHTANEKDPEEIYQLWKEQQALTTGSHALWFQEQERRERLEDSENTMSIEEQARLLLEFQHSQEMLPLSSSGSSSPRAVVNMQHGFVMYDEDPYSPQRHARLAGIDSNKKPSVIEEQERLWRELSRRPQQQPPHAEEPWLPVSLNTSGTASVLSPRKMSPQEEQAQLWEQIKRQNETQQGRSSTSYAGLSSFVAPGKLSPLEEQAQLMEEIQRNRSANTNGGRHLTNQSPAASGLSAIEEQARMLRALELQRNMNNSFNRMESTNDRSISDPVEQQAARLQEIQREKEQVLLDMACQISRMRKNDGSRLSLALSSLSDQNVNYAVNHDSTDVDDDLLSNDPLDDTSLQVILDFSRMEAEAHSKAQEEVDCALQVAMNRSREELMVCPLSDEVSLDAAELSQHDSEPILRESIADLSLKKSGGSVEVAEDSRRNSNDVSQPSDRRRLWNFRRK